MIMSEQRDSGNKFLLFLFLAFFVSILLKYWTVMLGPLGWSDVK